MSWVEKHRRQTLLMWLLLFACLVLMMVSLGVGRLAVPFHQVPAILLDNLWPMDGSWSAVQERVVELVRGPRILMAGVVGAGLAVAGASLQGVFRNPLVGPDIIGVSSGAAFGGALAIWLFDSSVMTVLLAFVFGLAAMVIVSLISRVGGQSPMLLLVLSGVVTGAFFSALVSLITYLADPEDRLPAIVYWLLGSFASANYERVWIVLVPTLIGSLVIFGMRYRINILSLGNEEAQALGVKVEKARWLILIMVALIASATVAVAGVIGWVGLVVPHFARMLVGADHRLLIPASAIIGAGYLVIIDTLARSATTSEIPLGVLTALVGAPLFVWLLRKTQAGGWRNA